MPKLRKTTADRAKDRASDFAGDLRDRIAPTVESARDAVGPKLAEARDTVTPKLVEARDTVAPKLVEARDKAYDKAGPALADARDRAVDRATPVVDGARDRFNADVVPVLVAAAAAASERTEEARTEGRRRGRAVRAALKGEVEPPKKTHRLRTFLLLLGLGGIAAVVARQLSGREPSTTWQSSYTPQPAAGTTAAETGSFAGSHRAEPDPDDVGGASPDVAAADAAAEPHPASTPDAPAETIDVRKD